MHRAQTVAHFSCCRTYAVRVDVSNAKQWHGQILLVQHHNCAETRALLDGHASAGCAHAVTST